MLFQCRGQFLLIKNSLKRVAVEGTISLLIAAHCSILSYDHLGELCQKYFKESDAALYMKLHRSKCTTIISNVLGSHFKQCLKEGIGDSFYSILIDESTDISVLKFLGIMYFDKNFKHIISTYLSLVKIESCNAQAIMTAVKAILNSKGLDLQKLCGI
ncbi:Domain of unknown function DUF4371 [Cinara cedri]|uniref:DUF4371 domain-containing protein n=1 Tax=Cinara cedri TaxID=506608 RepID=A0A5E4M2Z1_9HEMI|nr:Domain of unknown function DUF4371 [Cinara cedri]